MEHISPTRVIHCCFCDRNLSPGENQQETKSSITKYKCPGCERPYCSADCCSGHKEKFSCSGIRNPTPYLSLSKFDQKQFLDDYFFLEKVGNKVDSVQRAITKLRCRKPNNQGNDKKQLDKPHRFNKRRNKQLNKKQATAVSPGSDLNTDLQ